MHLDTYISSEILFRLCLIHIRVKSQGKRVVASFNRCNTYLLIVFAATRYSFVFCQTLKALQSDISAAYLHMHGLAIVLFTCIREEIHG